MNKIEWGHNAFIAAIVASLTSLIMLIVTGESVGMLLFFWYGVVSMAVSTIIDLRK